MELCIVGKLMALRGGDLAIAADETGALVRFAVPALLASGNVAA
ncbi:hypothetical protein GGQ88_004036 [Novosphingobium hassiacum]|uniref:Uncharacterized protein n=1 Tax=Novosphingobium hassiacum TaxID=173676 RepID=A0A7W6A0V9_9SPHN|nr:hypothetical protein [Novosphingobium hassiacum]MBB3862734.1 hypothetical protein [Novosphingobium hassiacum]